MSSAPAPNELPAPPDTAQPEPALSTQPSLPVQLPAVLAPLRPVLKWIVRVLPWASLGSGVFGAFVMDRGPKSAWLVAVSSIGIWIVLIGVRFMASRERPRGARANKLFVAAIELGLVLASQALMQLTLFFALPFFFYAAAFDIGHVFFLALLSTLSAVSLWDPLTERMLRHPWQAAALAAFGSFAALTAVLPALGLSTQVSLWLAVAIASVGFPLLAGMAVPAAGRLRAVMKVSALAALFPLVMYLGAARIVPAAPLRLVRAELGKQVIDKWIDTPVTTLDHVPPRLYCATAIASPMGLHDRLFHVWRKDGEPRARIELNIVGGRAQGYRTHSRISPNGAGKYTCSVETATGQVLGSRAVTLTSRGANHAAPAAP